MKKVILLGLLFGLSAMSPVSGHEPVTRARTAVNIPDIPGYVTLKCDLHMHTMFSDGGVWPTVRVEEAWREGLDAIAITDHIEYLPHKNDVSTNLNRSVEIAGGTGKELDIIVIRGSEITRKMPPGHLNAIFVTNSVKLAVAEWRDAAREAHEQGAFITWNHPGWLVQLTNDVTEWHPEHTELLEKHMMQGIEIVNGRDYYPEAHRWALEKKLTILSNSDVHLPLNLDYFVKEGDHRPITLVFAKERTADAIKDALFDRRTAVYTGNRLIGEEQFLLPIFKNSIHVLNPQVTIKGKQRVYVQITNDSDINYELEPETDPEEVKLQKELTLAARKTILMEVRGKAAVTEGKKKLEFPYKVTNLLIAPGEPLRVKINLEVTFTR
jgi:predicted metal-dependent phosphoesterase TrpH